MCNRGGSPAGERWERRRGGRTIQPGKVKAAAVASICAVFGILFSAPATASSYSETITVDLSTPSVVNNSLAVSFTDNPLTLRAGDTLDIKLKFLSGQSIQFTNFTQGNQDISLFLFTSNNGDVDWKFNGRLLDPIGIPSSNSWAAEGDCNCVYGDLNTGETNYSLSSAGTMSFDGLELTGSVVSTNGNSTLNQPFTSGNAGQVAFNSVSGLRVLGLPATPVPEPSSFTVLGLGLIALMAVGIRHTTAHAGGVVRTQ